MPNADIGIVGLGVMGRNLALNIAGKGYGVAGFDLDLEKVEAFANEGSALPVTGAGSLSKLVRALKAPRRFMMMVPAGEVVDKVIEQLLPHMQPGDIVIDGGNSHFADTDRRTAYLESKGFQFIGTGVSGGKEGALNGPSMMPGGSPNAWPHVRDIFQTISARVADGTPCCDWVGPNGAGHFVKMVHNGIEYSDMQLICEAYLLMKEILGLQPGALHNVFAEWNRGELNSYLVEITSRIFATKDPDSGQYVVDQILDTAGQKGTGTWTSVTALDLGVASPTIAEAVFARCLSAMKEERVEASKHLEGPAATFDGDAELFIEEIRKALYASKICSYAQGFGLMRAASDEYGWKLSLGDISMLWSEGCIIRAQFLGHIKEAYDRNPGLSNLLLDDHFTRAIHKAQPAWRHVVATSVKHGIPVPAFSSALAYFDGYRTARLPTNLLQAQRDFFGAHTYERVDKPRGEFSHTEWL